VTRNRTGQKIFAAVGGLLLGAFLTGCGSNPTDSATSKTGGTEADTDDGGKGLRLLFVTNSNADWWNAVEKGMTDGGEAFGANVGMRRNEGTTQGQIRLLEEAAGLSDVKGVAVSVIEADAPGVADALQALKDAGKIVITIDSDIAPASADVRSAYIGTNNVKAGESAGQAAAVIRPEGGKTCIFVGTSSAANARDRREGFFKGAGPKFTQLETFDDGGDKAKAQSNVTTALSKYKDVGVMLGLWSYNAPPIAEELAGLPEARKKISVVTFDLDELAVGHLEKGNIDVSVCQNPYEMGYQGVKLLKALVEKDEKAIREVVPDGKTRDTGVRVIVPSADSPVMKLKDKKLDVITIQEMKEWMSSKGLKSS
jgi:ribose transport system substrate-binding protein